MDLRLLLDRIGHKVVGVLVILVVIFMVGPMILALLTSFDAGELLQGIPKSFSLRWYSSFPYNDWYTSGLRASLEVAILAMIISTLTGTAASFALVRHRFPGKNALANFFMSPLIMPGVVLGFGLLGLFSYMGLRQSFLDLVIGHAVITMPFVIRTATATLLSFDVTLEEASMNLGAGRFRTLLNVTLPLIRTGVIAGSIFAFAISLDNISMTIFLVDPSLTTLPVILFAALRSGVNPSVAVASILLMSLTLFAMVIVDRVIGIERFIGLRKST